MADKRSTTEEARLYLEQLKQQGLDARAEEKAKQDYLRRLVAERESYVEAQLSARTKVSTGYQSIYRSGISAKASIAKALIDAKVKRDNAVLAAKAADLRSLRSALSHAQNNGAGAGLVSRALGAQSQARTATGAYMTRDQLQGAANTLATTLLPQQRGAGDAVRVFEQNYGDPVKAGWISGDAASRWEALKSSSADSSAAVGAILSAPSITAVIDGTASNEDYASAQKVLDDYLGKVDFNAADFDAPTGTELKDDEIVKDYDREIAKLKGEIGASQEDDKLTDEERARLVADPLFQEWAKDMGFSIGTAKTRLDASGQPVKNDQGYTLGDVSTYERGKDDDEAILYAARQIAGDKDLAFRPPLGEVIRFKVRGDEATNADRMRWSDGKFRTALDPKTGEPAYMPPEMEKTLAKQSATVEPLSGLWTRTDPGSGYPIEGYIYDPADDSTYWVDFVGGFSTKVDPSNAQQKQNYNNDVTGREKDWKPLYLPGDGHAVPATDPKAFAKVPEFDYDPSAFGGLAASPAAGMPDLTVSDKAPAATYTVVAQRAPRNLRTDRRGTLRTHDQRGDHVYDWDDKSGVYVERKRDYTPSEASRYEAVTGRTTSVPYPAETAVREEEEPPELRLGNRASMGPDEWDKPEVDRLNTVIDDPNASFSKKKAALARRDEIMALYKPESDEAAVARYASSPLNPGRTIAQKESDQKKLEASFAETRAADDAELAGEKTPAQMLAEGEAAQKPVQDYLAFRKQEPAARDAAMRYAALKAKVEGRDPLEATRAEQERWDSYVQGTKDAVRTTFPKPVQPSSPEEMPDLPNTQPSGPAIQPGSPAAVKRAQDLADKWAGTEADTRSVPAAAGDIAGSTGVNRARVRAILKAAEQKAKTPPSTVPPKTPEQYADEVSR